MSTLTVSRGSRSRPVAAPLKLNLGCGPVQPHGWVNVDGSMRAFLASRLTVIDRLLVALRLLPPTEFNGRTRWANLLWTFPWADDSVDMIYMGEILEHFTPEDGQKLLRQCYRVLRPGGVIRIRVPDNARFWENYLAEYRRMKQMPRSQWNLAHTRWIGMFFRDICTRRVLFKSIGHFHKWMYDEISLIKTLEDLGFQEVERNPFLVWKTCSHQGHCALEFLSELLRGTLGPSSCSGDLPRRE